MHASNFAELARLGEIVVGAERVELRHRGMPPLRRLCARERSGLSMTPFGSTTSWRRHVLRAHPSLGHWRTQIGKKGAMSSVCPVFAEPALIPRGQTRVVAVDPSGCLRDGAPERFIFRRPAYSELTQSQNGPAESGAPRVDEGGHYSFAVAL